MPVNNQIATLRARAARCRRLQHEVPDEQARAALLQLAATYDEQAATLEQEASGKQPRRFTRTAAE
jgi:predicted  nucleic acid-binding Zn-ribbon protein